MEAILRERTHKHTDVKTTNICCGWKTISIDIGANEAEI